MSRLRWSGFRLAVCLPLLLLAGPPRAQGDSVLPARLLQFAGLDALHSADLLIAEQLSTKVRDALEANDCVQLLEETPPYSEDEEECQEPSCAPAAPEPLTADFILGGTLVRIEGNYLLSLLLLESGQEQPLAHTSARGSTEGLGRNLRKPVEEILKPLHCEGPQAAEAVSREKAQPAPKGWDVDRLIKNCRRNRSDACRNLGWLHENGQGFVRDEKRAAEYYERACNLRDPWGCNYLGYFYQEGRLGPADYERARHYYDQACSQNHADACDRLAWMYQNGQGDPEDSTMARKLYKKSCDLILAKACHSLGWMHEYGLGGERDLKEAESLYRKACKGNDADGCWAWAEMLAAKAKGEKDEAAIRKLYRKACQLGRESACQHVWD